MKKKCDYESKVAGLPGSLDYAEPPRPPLAKPVRPPLAEKRQLNDFNLVSGPKLGFNPSKVTLAQATDVVTDGHNRPLDTGKKHFRTEEQTIFSTGFAVERRPGTGKGQRPQGVSSVFTS